MHNSNFTFKNNPNTATIIGVVLSLLLPVLLTILLAHFKLNFLDKLCFSFLIRWSTVLFLFFYANKIEQRNLLLWKGDDNGTGFVLTSVAVLYVLYVVASLLAHVPGMFGFQETYEVFRTMDQLLQGHPGYIFLISITAGVTEELIFRGYLLTRLSILFKEPHISIVISSLLFAVMHYGYYSLLELLGTFFMGVFFSLFYIRYRNIYPLIIAHFLIDLIALS